MQESIQFRNKEISWLAFNRRVLQEAQDKSVPLLERLKFIGIYSNNLDEFFRVRVATLKRFAFLGKQLKDFFDEDPGELIRQINQIVFEQHQIFLSTYNEIIDELKKENIFFRNENELNEGQKIFVQNYFQDKVRVRLFPVFIRKRSNFNYLRDEAIYLAIDLMRKNAEVKHRSAILKIPTPDLPRFLELPSEPGKNEIIYLDDIIRLGINVVFSALNYSVSGAYTIKITRNAELDIEDDIDQSYIEKVKNSLEKRKVGQPVRFIYDKEMPDQLLAEIIKDFQFAKTDTIISRGRYHNFKDFMDFPDLNRPDLKYTPWEPVRNKYLHQNKSIFSSIFKKDILLHFPYQPFSHIIDLLREAALDPKVSTIKITVYRVAMNSAIMNALVNASRNGKQVSAVLELQARFNEKSNIYWAKKLSESGVKVINGVPGLKVHAKLLLIYRKEEKNQVLYAAVGTGNFNEETSKSFSDVFLLTKNKEITKEVEQVFEFFSRNYKIYPFKKLLVSPFNSRNELIRLIDQEIKNKENGKKATIWLKLNNFSDHALILKIHEAHVAGVDVRLMVRGMFSMYSDNDQFQIHIPSHGIIDRYLEHARILYFYAGGEEKVFISSADLMDRNLDRRVEVICPVDNIQLKEQIIHVLKIEWKDNTKARALDNALSNQYIQGKKDKPFQAQAEIYQYIKKLHSETKS